MAEGMADPARRVAFFLPDLHAGGAERVVLSLSKFLCRQGVAVDLLLGRVRGELMTEIPKGVRVIALTGTFALPSRAGLALGALWGLLRYLRRDPPATLAASLTGANLVAIAAHRLAGGRTRLVLREANTVENLRGPLMRTLVRRSYPAADVIVAVSEGVRRDLIDALGIEADKVRVIYNPVDLEDVERKKNAPSPHGWFSPDAPPVVLGAGRLVPQKDFVTLLRAFAKLRQRQNARLMILGEGPLRTELQQLASRLGVATDVTMPGYVDNPFPYFERAAVFVLSSRWEGLPNVLVQALASGTPLIATDCHSGPREILDDGRFGRLVTVGDAAGLAKALEKALSGDDLANTASRIERSRFFSLERIGPQYLQLLCSKNRFDCYS